MYRILAPGKGLCGLTVHATKIQKPRRRGIGWESSTVTRDKAPLCMCLIVWGASPLPT